MSDKTVFEEAEGLVNGPRQAAYGSPYTNIRKIADMWEAYTGRAYSVEDVCIMMALVKLARLSHTVHRDGVVDVCGYMRLMEIVG